MGVGCPEYILLFRKLPTDTSRGYADEPVRKSIQSQYANIIAQEDWAAYLKALRAKYKIKINQEALEKTPQSEEAF